ncbi:nucleoside triphosphate pyrophosphohydrolase [soil metagenome]
MPLATNQLDRLLTIMNELREKCPWDKKQTIQSLRQQTIEETYELADAITDKDWNAIREELGDLLLHIVFYSKIATEEKKFSINEVIDDICEKLVKRHPHVYEDVRLANDEEVKRNWEQLKLKEGKKSVLSGLPKTLPALVKAMRLQEKAKQVGFEWNNKEDVWKKVEEEQAELAEAIMNGKQQQVEEEAGDMLFSIVNYLRFLNVDAENALEITNKKFIRRFTIMEEQAKRQDKDLNGMSLAEMDAMWNEIKKQNLNG